MVLRMVHYGWLLGGISTLMIQTAKERCAQREIGASCGEKSLASEKCF